MLELKTENKLSRKNSEENETKIELKPQFFIFKNTFS